jgi:neurotransmitter:Na+ symporter, NSS family
LQDAGAHIPKKDTFSSRFAFMISTAGSAIGLGNIWKFPYIVGKYGGGSFLLIYALFLILVGFPAFLSEILIGKTTQKGPAASFFSLGKTLLWKGLGTFTIWTGFLVSSFYGVVAGWILGYTWEALLGRLDYIQHISHAKSHYSALMSDPYWSFTFHGLFMVLCLLCLVGGIRNGIEKSNRIFMPIFFVILFALAGWALSLPTAKDVCSFMTDFSGALPAKAVMVALGHAFFTLSVGQGTLVTYGSYLKPRSAILSTATYIVIADTLVSVLAAFAVLSIVFYAGMEIEFGPGLVFQTLPTIFASLPCGILLSVSFFFLVFIAAITSQVSALEPLIAYITETFQLKRKHAAIYVVCASFILGVPSSLSTSLLSSYTLFGYTFLDLMDFCTTSLFIPMGGLFALVLLGWKAGLFNVLKHLQEKEQRTIERSLLLKTYLTLTIVYVAPVFVLIVFLQALIR